MQDPGGTRWTNPVDDTTGPYIIWDDLYEDSWETLRGFGEGTQSALNASVSTESNFSSAGSQDVTFTVTQDTLLSWDIIGLDENTYNFAALWHDDGVTPPFWNYDSVDLVFGHGGQIDEPADWQTSGSTLLTAGDYQLRLWAGWGDEGLYTMSASLNFTAVPAPGGLAMIALMGLGRSRRRRR